MISIIVTSLTYGLLAAAAVEICVLVLDRLNPERYR